MSSEYKSLRYLRNLDIVAIVTGTAVILIGLYLGVLTLMAFYSAVVTERWSFAVVFLVILGMSGYFITVMVDLLFTTVKTAYRDTMKLKVMRRESR